MAGTSFAPRHSGWSSVLAIVACSMLMVLAQLAIGYLSTMILSKIFNGTFTFSLAFTISNPSMDTLFNMLQLLAGIVLLLCPLLICSSSAFFATKGLGPIQMCRKGLILGAYSGIGYTLLLLSLLFGYTLRVYQYNLQIYIQCGNHPCGYWFGFGWNLLVGVLPLIVGYALVVLLTAPLAGWLGSLLRSRSPFRRSVQQRPLDLSQRAVVIALGISCFLVLLLFIGMYFLERDGWLYHIWGSVVTPSLSL